MEKKVDYTSKIIEIVLFIITIFVLFSDIITGFNNKANKKDVSQEVKIELEIINSKLTGIDKRLDHLENKVYK